MKTIKHIKSLFCKISYVQYIFSVCTACVFLCMAHQVNAQRQSNYLPGQDGRKHDGTNAAGWDFSIRDNNGGGNEAEATSFAWWDNGVNGQGGNPSQIMMELLSYMPDVAPSSPKYNIPQRRLYVDGEGIYLTRAQTMVDKSVSLILDVLARPHIGAVSFQTPVDKSVALILDDTSSYLRSEGLSKGLHISSSTGNKIHVGDENDNVYLQGAEVITKAQNVTLNYGGPTDTAKISINTAKKVDQAVLTVAGATYIGPKAELAADNSLYKFKPEYLEAYNLWVEDGIVTEDFVIRSVDRWSDFVFAEDYELKSLGEVETYINTHKHLPGVKSEAEVKKEGYSLMNMDIVLLEKVEELTLYTIAQEKKIEELEEELQQYSSLQQEILQLKKLILSSQK